MGDVSVRPVGKVEGATYAIVEVNGQKLIVSFGQSKNHGGNCFSYFNHLLNKSVQTTALLQKAMGDAIGAMESVNVVRPFVAMIAVKRATRPVKLAVINASPPFAFVSVKISMASTAN